MKVRRSLLKDAVAVETYVGDGAYGPVYAAARFKGATPVQAWMPLPPHEGQWPAARASKGPRPFRRGCEQARGVWWDVLHASKGPRPFRRGCHGDICSRVYLERASKGPRPFRRGCPDAGRSTCRLLGASKGPRPFRRGCQVGNLLRELASSLLQRGHARSGVDARVARIGVVGCAMASKGPRPFRRGC